MAAPGPNFIVLTGLSGSGKSQAMRALEDLGYFVVDNLPITLLPTFAELTRRANAEIEKAAVVIDVREGALLKQFPKVFKALRAIPKLDPTLIFRDASDAALVRRYSETRRPHPLAGERSAMEGLREERARLAPIRAMADEIIDTSDLNVHELREAFMSRSLGAPTKVTVEAPLTARIVSGAPSAAADPRRSRTTPTWTRRNHARPNSLRRRHIHSSTSPPSWREVCGESPARRTSSW